MEITSNQAQPVTLEGIKPTKVSSVMVTEKSQVVGRAVETNSFTSQVNVAEIESVSTPAESLRGAVSQINDYVQNLQRNLQFTVDESTGKDIVTVIDTVSEEIIRQIPSEEALELARRLMASKEDGVQLISTRV